MSANLRQTPLTCSGHTRPVVFVAFSQFNPEDTAKYFSISACKDGKPMLRQGDTGDWVGTFEGHKGAVWGVDLNAKATKAASGAADFSAKIWDAVTGEESITLAHNHIVKSVNFSGDSQLLATGSNDKKLRIFDLEHHEDGPLTVFEGHTSGLKQVLFSGPGNEQSLISAGDDKTLRLWDARTGKECRSTDFEDPIGGVELSRDGQTLTVAWGNTVTFCDSFTLEKTKEVKVPTLVYSASLLKENKIFVCGGEDLKLYKYNYDTGEEIENFKGHFGAIHCVRFAPDGELYASGSEDGTLRLWQTEVGKNYGLWKCVDTVATDTVPGKAEAVVA